MTKRPITSILQQPVPAFKFQSFLKLLKPLFKFKLFQSRSSSSSSNSTLKQKSANNGNDKEYPTGDFDFKPVTGFNKFLVKLKILVALPWERVEHRSILKIILRGQVSLLSCTQTLTCRHQ